MMMVASYILKAGGLVLVAVTALAEHVAESDRLLLFLLAVLIGWAGATLADRGRNDGHP